jgi:hypothetical protein
MVGVGTKNGLEVKDDDEGEGWGKEWKGKRNERGWSKNDHPQRSIDQNPKSNYRLHRD